MAKFNHRAKWDRREVRRREREDALHVCNGDDPFLDRARGILIRSEAAKAAGDNTLVLGSKGKIKVLVVGDNILTIKTGGDHGVEEIRRLNGFLNSGDRSFGPRPSSEPQKELEVRIQGQIEELRMRKLRDLVIEKASNGEFDEQSAAILFEPERAENLKVMASEILVIKGRIALAFHESGLPEVVTTFGVYPNGPSNSNGVALGDLPYHIWYNLRYRPGRALIVHDRVWYAGIGVDEEKLETERQACVEESFPIATRPYH